MIKVCFFVFGILFILLGIVGLMLPVVPQIPFLVVGTLLLCAGSDRFRRKFVGSALYERYLRSWFDSHEKLKRITEPGDEPKEDPLDTTVPEDSTEDCSGATKEN